MREAAPRPDRPRRRAASTEKRSHLVRGSAIRLCLSGAPPREAARIARVLLVRRVAACVTVLPGVTSTYRWKGKVERARETLLVAKTTASALSRCVAVLASEHPYELPEILVCTPAQASAAYAAWVDAETD